MSASANTGLWWRVGMGLGLISMRHHRPALAANAKADARSGYTLTDTQKLKGLTHGRISFCCFKVLFGFKYQITYLGSNALTVHFSLEAASSKLQPWFILLENKMSGQYFAERQKHESVEIKLAGKNIFVESNIRAWWLQNPSISAKGRFEVIDCFEVSKLLLTSHCYIG